MKIIGFAHSFGTDSTTCSANILSASLFSDSQASESVSSGVKCTGDASRSKNIQR